MLITGGILQVIRRNLKAICKKIGNYRVITIVSGGIVSDDDFYSCLNAMIGSTLAAAAAGYRPKIIPIATLINSGRSMLDNVITVGILAKNVMITGMVIPMIRPTIPPSVESTTVSIRN